MDLIDVFQSRVEQQSELIMMLKTHNDNMSREMRELDKSRAAALESASRADKDRAELVCSTILEHVARPE